MFADSLLESSPHAGHRSAWTKLTSALLQSAMLAIALAIPLFHIERLQVVPPPPSIQMTNIRQPIAEHIRSSSAASLVPSTEAQLVYIRHDRTYHPTASNASPESAPLLGIGIRCASNCESAVPITNIVSVGSPMMTPPPTRPAGPVRISEMQLGALVRKVMPEYPTIARQLRIQGAVILMAMVGKDGRVEELHLISGHPMLVNPAMRAVAQWQYRPYLLNHEPVVVQTQITVNFVLNRD